MSDEGERLRRLCALAGISQVDLAKELGEEKGFVSRRVRGHSNLSHSEVARISTALAGKGGLKKVPAVDIDGYLKGKWLLRLDLE